MATEAKIFRLELLQELAVRYLQGVDALLATDDVETIFCPREKDVETLLIPHEARSLRASQVNDDDIEFTALTAIDLILPPVLDNSLLLSALSSSEAL